jgi:NADH:ubiquinone oxidoreductase subunit C
MTNNNLLFIENLKILAKIFPIKKIQIYNHETTIVFYSNDFLDGILFFKNNILCQFKLLTCISGVDYPSNKYRFKIVYEVLSIRYNSRLRIKIFNHELVPANSCESFYPNAGWFECEIWDMFGVFFQNHSNLRRILTDYGFEGYPLRKDFPLSGYVEMSYNEIQKGVKEESIELSQEYRDFDTYSLWEKPKV